MKPSELIKELVDTQFGRTRNYLELLQKIVILKRKARKILKDHEEKLNK